MDAVVLHRLNSLNLREEEEVGLQVAQTDIHVSHDECQRSLIGRIFGDKLANYTGVKNNFSALWNSIAPFKLRELGQNFFLFIFATQQDKLHILHTKIWTFEGQFLLLKPWSAELEKNKESFHTVHLWVQVWHLPTHWISLEMGRRFKSLFPDVLDVLIPEGGSKKGCHIKLLAEIDLNKPLLRGTKLRLQDQVIWATFEYEKLATFCFYCGRVGHLERNCAVRTQDAKNGTLTRGQYGDWLKASIPKFPPKPLSPQSRDIPPPSPSAATKSSTPGQQPSTLPNDPSPQPTEHTVADQPLEIQTTGIQVHHNLSNISVFTQTTTVQSPPLTATAQETLPSISLPAPKTTAQAQDITPMLLDPILPSPTSEQLAFHILEDHPPLHLNLVNVPVNTAAVPPGRPKTGTRAKKSWHRAPGKENTAPVCIPKSPATSLPGSHKRPWTLIDEDAETPPLL